MVCLKKIKWLQCREWTEAEERKPKAQLGDPCNNPEDE